MKNFSKNCTFSIDLFLANVYINITFARMNGCLAQLVEQWTVNPCVAGSKPAAAANPRFYLGFFYLTIKFDITYTIWKESR